MPNTFLLDVEKITVKEGLPRFRQNMGKLQDLAYSIKQFGQFQPIVINRERELIIGGRRLEACKLYKMPVLCSYYDTVDPLIMRGLELEENIQRLDFSPAEHCLAVRELHKLKTKTFVSEPTATMQGTQWTLNDTAELTNASRASVSGDIELANIIDVFPELKNCKTKNEIRKAAKGLGKLIDRVSGLSKNQDQLLSQDSVVLVQETAQEFMTSLEDNSIDILLTDPPYGIDIAENAIGLGGKTGNPTTTAGFSFDDKPKHVLHLYTEIAMESARFCSSAAHAYIFVAPEYFPAVRNIFLEAGWSPCMRPLIWIKSGPQGQANRPDFWPVSSYEMCLYARRAASKLLYARPDFIICDRVSSSKKRHPTEKPLALLRDLISRSVQPGSILVDPCCGSGSSLVAGLQEKLIVKGSDPLFESYSAAIDYIAEEMNEDGNSSSNKK